MTFGKTFWAMFLALVAFGIVSSIAMGIRSCQQAADERERLRRELFTPTPEPAAIPQAEAPSLFNSVPKTVKVTLDADVYTKEGKHVVIPAGTKLPVISKQGQNVTIEYNGERFTIPAGITEAVQ